MAYLTPVIKTIIRRFFFQPSSLRSVFRTHQGRLNSFFHRTTFTGGKDELEREKENARAEEVSTVTIVMAKKEIVV